MPLNDHIEFQKSEGGGDNEARIRPRVSELFNFFFFQAADKLRPPFSTFPFKKVLDGMRWESLERSVGSV